MPPQKCLQLCVNRHLRSESGLWHSYEKLVAEDAAKNNSLDADGEDDDMVDVTGEGGNLSNSDAEEADATDSADAEGRSKNLVAKACKAGQKAQRRKRADEAAEVEGDEGAATQPPGKKRRKKDSSKAFKAKNDAAASERQDLVCAFAIHSCSHAVPSLRLCTTTGSCVSS